MKHISKVIKFEKNLQKLKTILKQNDLQNGGIFRRKGKNYLVNISYLNITLQFFSCGYTTLKLSRQYKYEYLFI